MASNAEKWNALLALLRIKNVLGSHLHQNRKTTSMSPEGIRLFFTIFPLVSVFQHNANCIAVFRHNFHQYNSPAFLSISLRFVDRQSFRAQPISYLDDPMKTTTFILAFYSSPATLTDMSGY